VILPLLVCVRANAQAASGGLSGKVAVASGTGILNARVTLKNTAKDYSRTMATDAAGF
jgi:hypothetical protein